MVRTCEQRAMGQRTWPENKPLPLRVEPRVEGNQVQMVLRMDRRSVLFSTFQAGSQHILFYCSLLRKP